MIRSALIDKAYNYFPKGIEDSHPDYENTSENVNLQSALSVKPIHSELIDKIGVDIRGECSEVSAFENFSFFPKYDRCVKCRIIYSNNGKSKAIGLYVSLIIPVYVIMESIYTGKAISSQSFIVKQEISNEAQAIAEVVKFHVAQCWPEYYQLPDDTLNTFVEDIVFDGNGKFITYENCDEILPLTVFNIFFTNYLF